ncbi:nitrilase-related carbon-nitrogen hydrolase [Pseudomonas sp. BJa5]|uniref:nitrilase-related carbon-nitrogen hydrolase n=1 Tax=Pseudomonas sp. BJa5 TaxID=2936270 RepID=UPI0025599252|nr:nitrilase-related carbon-nitrogen hydrolase [Pseudomonas sp. BGr12]MDL2423669.1 carbon-nitrogen hydrolase [Pseudomonas sp. BGr12]
MSVSNNVKVACCQLAPKIGDLAHNRRICERAIRHAAQQGARVVVLPELVQSGYLFHDLAEALAHAEALDGPTLQLWQALALELDIVIVGGFCEQLDQQRVANSAALVDSSGLRVVYRKAHLWDGEHAIFTPGSEAPPVVETAVGRIGVMICYDIEFPEWVRLPALAGAELICVPVNWPDGPRPAIERPNEVVRVQANASVNRVFIAACDRHGQERGMNWVQGSVIVDADGYPVAGPAEAAGEQILVATLRLGEARNKYISRHNHLHQDRRPELYRAGGLLEQVANG